MRVKALKTFTEFHKGSMVVLNAGDVGEISDRRAEDLIGAGMAEAVEPESAPADDELTDRPVTDEAPADEQPEPESASEPQDEAVAEPEAEPAAKPARGKKAAAETADEAPAA